MTEIRNKVPELNSAWADDHIITSDWFRYIEVFIFIIDININALHCMHTKIHVTTKNVEWFFQLEFIKYISVSLKTSELIQYILVCLRTSEFIKYIPVY
jgi:hypothetical protein